MRIPTKAPWPFSISADPNEPMVPNEPCEAGAELGAELARLCDVEEARLRGAAAPASPARCRDCAFRQGTKPNQCVATVMDAIKCLVERDPFYCHHGVPDEAEPTRLCAGYEILSKASQ